MTATTKNLLHDVLVNHLAKVMEGAEPGHCVRIDDVAPGLGPTLVDALRQRLPGVAVNILRADPAGDIEIPPQKAIELRNRKLQACLLLVPAGEGHAASSLDNSFKRIPMLDLFSRADLSLVSDLTNQVLLEAVRRLRRSVARADREAWAEFMAAIVEDPTEQAFGENLWRIGLIPDLGPEPLSRLGLNVEAAHAISRPSRPAATIDDRLSAANMKIGAWRVPLRDFLDQRGSRLSNARLWAHDIATTYRHLSFEHWPAADRPENALEKLEVDPFTNPDGTLIKASKLDLGADGQLILTVPEDGAAPVVVTWKTDPINVADVAKWRLEVARPADQRRDDDEPLVSMTAPGTRKRATVKVSITEDDLAEGARFVVVLTALGANGEEVDLTSGEPAVAESEEFQIAVGDAPESKARRTAAPSLPEAVVRAALDGLDDLTEDLVTWDLAGQVFGLRLGNRRAVQVRVNELIIRLQRQATADPMRPTCHSAQGSYGTPLEWDGAGTLDVNLPAAVKKARSDFLKQLAAGGPRDTIESARWTDELREAAKSYAASFRRAIDSAEDESLRDLLLVDTLSLSVQRSNHSIDAVVLLPIHPLRVMWVATFDELVRGWADELTDVTPRSARPSMLSAEMVGQVVPANLPFSVLHHGGKEAVYAEELTYGSGLYIVPGPVDSDAAAESICSVLDLDRATSTMRASSRLVAQRIRAYERAHDPGAALRLLTVNPGSGELLAGALSSLSRPAELDDEESSEVLSMGPRRSEVIAYTDSWSYVSPVPRLLALQADLRHRESVASSTHLAPPLSLSVRNAESLMEDSSEAHMALLQDPGVASLGLGTSPERKPSFRDMLVPLVTTSREENGDLVWESVPCLGGGSGDSELVSLHRAHQRALARRSGGSPDSVPAVHVTLDGDAQARIRAAHQRADWVIGIDKFVGVNLFESGLSDPFILDYAPDFVEGIGDRLTVTTTHRSEVEFLLAGAMSELGLDEVESSVGSVLQTLAVVSGRLALRLLENTTQAREAVSLAALVGHLTARGELANTIVVPVDAHPEIFGHGAHDEGVARRCDLLLVRLSQRSFKIECVEVKSRKEAHIAQTLADTIIEQLQVTKQVLESRFFSDPPRIDAELQMARLTSLLHYYADRAATHKLIDPTKLNEIHRYIDRVEEKGERAEISMTGWVISLDGAQGFKKQYGEIPLRVLTAQDLGQIGLSTRARLDPLPESLTPVTPVTPKSEPEPLPLPPVLDPEDPEEGDRAEEKGQPVTEEAEGEVEKEAHPSDVHDADDLSSASEKPPTNSVSEPATPTPVVPPEDPEESVATTTKEVVVTLGDDPGGSPVHWRVSTKGSPHAFVIGIPGQGKSVTTRKVIRDFEQQGLPSLVFDFHGDMAADPPAGAVVLDAALGLPFSPFEPDVESNRPINSTAWEIAEIIAYVAKLGEIQRTHVYGALKKVYADTGWAGSTRGDRLPTMPEFATALEEVEKGAAGKNAAARLLTFTDFGLFREDATGGFELRTDPPQGWIIDLSHLMEEVQRFAASFILRRVYREMFAWPQDSTMKLAVVLDEAHRMARDVTLPKLMKEGRKYGVGVIVASQSADDFHKDVLGNAGTKIVFRTNFPASKEVAKLLRGRNGVDLSQHIEKLDVGVAYVSTPDAVQAQKVYMARE
ncbi:ATP-binding protein [Nocardioides zhouii]|uniref:ATP-binding protein n=1 Tax=Nocardioides zhouii TaxID=1168729 RepID=A0A4Q2SE95_9ACTN|nr:ATP-binding protein [Nocardioides zhouii]RYC03333.1 ATP-binding protein [Nocardioides zhouii]